MMRYFVAAAGAVFLIFAAQAQGGPGAGPENPPSPPRVDLAAWTRPLAEGMASIEIMRSSVPEVEATSRPERDIDVVDAHWMALTMWGEARSEGEEGMRAVGHVIHNRTLVESHGAFVTDTVSAAFQFSCWNAGDPNRKAMLNIDALPQDSEDYRLWLVAKRIADDILSGRSGDPTGGALFYHTAAVRPAWSRGVVPDVRIGDHLFFRTLL